MFEEIMDRLGMDKVLEEGYELLVEEREGYLLLSLNHNKKVINYTEVLIQEDLQILAYKEMKRMKERLAHYKVYKGVY